MKMYVHHLRPRLRPLFCNLLRMLRYLGSLRSVGTAAGTGGGVGNPWRLGDDAVGCLIAVWLLVFCH